MNKREQALLDAYSLEITGDSSFLTLEFLIEAHRRLRSRNLETLEAIDQARERAYKEAKEASLDAVWVKWEDLANMSLREIGEKIYDL